MNQKSTTSTEIILGLDPGTTVMGFGLIEVRGSKLKVIQYGVIKLSQYKGHEVRLQKIYNRVSSIIEEFNPDFVALEAPFFGKNVQSMLKLGRAQGVAMAAALAREIPITEYAPRKVKQAVTGNGNASKEQVAYMLQKLLGLKELPEFLDATDALGVAVCHFFQGGKPDNKTKSWADFLSKNKKRII